MTAASCGVLRLSVSNDGAAGPAAGNGGSGHGLANLTRAGRGCRRLHDQPTPGGRFDLIAEIPLPVG